MCDEPLCSLRTHEMGRLVAVGTESGATYIVQFSENLSTSNKNDKMLLTAVNDFLSVFLQVFIYINCRCLNVKAREKRY